MGTRRLGGAVLGRRVSIVAHRVMVGAKSPLRCVLTIPRLRTSSVFLSPPWGGVSYMRNTHNDDTLEPGSDPLKQPAHLPPPTSRDSFDLRTLLPLSACRLVDICLEAFGTPNIALYIPRSSDLAQIAHIGRCVGLHEQKQGGARSLGRAPSPSGIGTSAGDSPSAEAEEPQLQLGQVALEEEWMSRFSLKALTCYFGHLAGFEPEEDSSFDEKW